MGPLPQVAHLYTRTAEETQALGSFIGRAALPGDIYLLTGDLGSGKTCLTQGIAWGLGVKEHALSPSFVLVREYGGRLPLYHMDLYRLDCQTEIVDLGLDEYFHGNGVCVIEWADRCMPLMPDQHLLIDISHRPDEGRDIKLTPKGSRYSSLLAGVLSETEATSWNCPLIPPQA